MAGACRGIELLQLSVNDVTDLGNVILVNIKNTKNQIERNFVVKNSDKNAINFIELCKKYMALRKPETAHSRFFVRYVNKQCTTQSIGKNTFGKLPQQIAEFLNLPDSSLYTGHCFRRTSASLLADSGANVDILKRHGGWRSATVAEGYVENSVNNKKIIANQIFGHTQKVATTSKPLSDQAAGASISELSATASASSTLAQHTFDENNRLLNIVNCSDIKVNVNINY